MSSSLNGYKSYQHHLHNLLSDAYQETEIEQGLEEALLGMLDDLTAMSHSLEGLDASASRGETLNKLWETYEPWTFGDLPEVEQPGVRQLLSKLPNSNRIIALLDQVNQARQKILERKKAFEERILADWRRQYPRFSSMGVLDEDVQSDVLKSTRPLARS